MSWTLRGDQATQSGNPARDDAHVRLRTARLRRGMTQIALAEMACVSPSFVSMVETGERELTRVCDIVALADVLKVSPLYLVDGRLDASQLDSGLPTQCRSQPAVTPTRWPGISSSPLSSSGSPGRTATRPGTGYAGCPASPACIPGCCSTSSPHPAQSRSSPSK
jgi:transcriptional regulator with XRE-family HTH domain